MPRCVRCDADDGTVDHLNETVCDNCLTPYEGRRMEGGVVLAEFYDKARYVIDGLLRIIQQEVYPAMNRIPECDNYFIECAVSEIGHLRDEVEQGLVKDSYLPCGQNNDAERAERRKSIIEMVDGMNKNWEDRVTYPNPTYKIGWNDPIKIPYPEGCHPVTKLKAESTPFVLSDSWRRADD